MNVRIANDGDLPRLMQVYREAREIMLSYGNVHQWKYGHPSAEMLQRDIDNGYCNVVEDGGVIVGAFAFIPGEDPTYLKIEEGEWVDDTLPYATIHRLGSTRSSKGVAKACFDWCWTQSHNLRIDTHKDNRIMRHCIERFGFRYCGVIHLLNGDPRYAYQKVDSGD